MFILRFRVITAGSERIDVDWNIRRAIRCAHRWMNVPARDIIIRFGPFVIPKICRGEAANLGEIFPQAPDCVDCTIIQLLWMAIVRG